MSDKVNYIPEGHSSITPYLVIRGAAKAIDYYKNVLGATVEVRMDGPDGKVGHAELRVGNSKFMLADENPAMGNRSPESIGGSPVSLYVYLPDCDKVVENAAQCAAICNAPCASCCRGARVARCRIFDG